jgi:SNF2 family DNA or RNA helicase
MTDYKSPEGLTLSGYGKIGLAGVLGPQFPRIAVKVSTPSGEFVLPPEAGIPEDHIVIDDIWIPLRESECALLLAGLKNSGVLLEEPATNATTARLLVMENELGIPFELTREFQAAIQASNNALVPSLKVTPYPYQAQGIQWLCDLYSGECGGLLADEMGLGKTLQLLGLVDFCISQSPLTSRVLVVVPGSLTLNWCTEFLKFSSTNDVLVHTGPNRNFRFSELTKHSVILTTYDILVRDQDLLSGLQFDLVICDEAHWLKNPNTQKRTAVSRLKSKAKFMVTGTPIHNRLMDLWSLMDLVQPGILGPHDRFERTVRDSPDEARLLGDQVASLILRRTGKQVELQLPETVTSIVPLELSADEKQELSEIRTGKHPATLGQSGRATFQKQREFCAHTASLDYRPDSLRGSKAKYIRDEVEKIKQLGEKVLIFVSDLIRPSDILAEMLHLEFPSTYVRSLDGRISADTRFALVEEFSAQPGFAVLLINPTVGGEGLNITSANHVIHVNPPWNPAKQEQATFRVVRPGQRKTSFVQSLYYADSIEDRMMKLLDHKREISEEALEEAEIQGGNLFTTAAFTTNYPIIEGK